MTFKVAIVKVNKLIINSCLWLDNSVKILYKQAFKVCVTGNSEILHVIKI